MKKELDWDKLIDEAEETGYIGVENTIKFITINLEEEEDDEEER